VDNTDRGSRLEAWTGSGRDFADVFREEFPRLAGYCTGLVGDREVGADLAQEALARTWVRWSKVSSPRAYSYLVATNLARRHSKRLATEARIMPALASQQVATTPADMSVRDMVERLPERLRSAAVLHYYADLPVAEVARLLRRPQGTIRQRLHEARQVLATDLERQERS
jgi:RNA polymerase sigma-70 factor (ECF subfamily)